MKPWEIASVPEEAGVSSKGLLRYLDEVAASGLEHHSILVWKDGKLACKLNYAPYDDQTPHVLFSLSKSFTSAAAGFAVGEGLLRWDSKVLDVLADKAPKQPSEWLKQVTLAHLLTMGSGLKPESDEIDHLLIPDEGPTAKPLAGGLDWAKAVLACDCDHQPGTHFHYNSHGTYLVSAMVQRVTGQNIRDYLMPRLFTPLGIPKPDWDCCPQGVCCGGWGLHLSSDSILRFGVCLIQGGVWQGRQVLPAEWLKLATVKQIDNSNGKPEPENEWHQGYGYQFWRTRENRYRGDGMFGQLCMVSPDDHMVVAVTAGIDDMGREMKLLHDFLFTAGRMEPGTAEEQKAFLDRAAHLAYPWPSDDGSGTVQPGEYVCDELTLTVGEVQDGVLPVKVVTADGNTLSFCFGMGEIAAYTRPCFVPGAPDLHCMGACGWRQGTLILTDRTTEGPFTLHASLRVEDGGCVLETSGAGSPNKTFVLRRR